MIKLLHDNHMLAEAFRLYMAAKNIKVSIEQIGDSTRWQREILDNIYYGKKALPLLHVDNETWIPTTHSIIDYIENTYKANRIFCSDPSPNAKQTAEIHNLLSNIQEHLYIKPRTPVAVEVRLRFNEVFVDFFQSVQQTKAFIDPAGFTILDCFFYPATTVFLVNTREQKSATRTAVQDYRDRVEAYTIYKNDPNKNPDLWETDETDDD